MIGINWYLYTVQVSSPAHLHRLNVAACSRAVWASLSCLVRITVDYWRDSRGQITWKSLSLMNNLMNNKRVQNWLEMSH